MKIDLDGLLDRSFVISIDRDSLEFFHQQWSLAGFSAAPKPVRGIQMTKDGWCSKSRRQLRYNLRHISIINTHRMIIAMAQAMDFPYVGIFEDDAIGCIGVKEKMAEVLSNVPDDADMLYLGTMDCRDIEKDLGNGFMVPGNVLGIQSYIVFRSGYEHVLESSERNTFLSWRRHFQHPYMTKDPLFCQYVRDHRSRFHASSNGFFHTTYSKECLDKNFKVNGQTTSFLT